MAGWIEETATYDGDKYIIVVGGKQSSKIESSFCHIIDTKFDNKYNSAAEYHLNIRWEGHSATCVWDDDKCEIYVFGGRL